MRISCIALIPPLLGLPVVGVPEPDDVEGECAAVAVDRDGHRTRHRPVALAAAAAAVVVAADAVEAARVWIRRGQEVVACLVVVARAVQDAGGEEGDGAGVAVD